jgi:hypothetical protein
LSAALAVDPNAPKVALQSHSLEVAHMVFLRSQVEKLQAADPFPQREIDIDRNRIIQENPDRRIR